MTPAEATRPVLLALIGAGAALSLSACDGDAVETQRFETMARAVAAVDVSGGRSASGGLRGADFSPVKVAVMDPHEMWDARDAQAAGMRGAVEMSAPPPAIVRAVVRSREAAPPPTEADLTVDAGTVAPDPTSAAPRMIQLGAYGSEAMAQAAWEQLSGRSDLQGVEPVFEPVERGGSRLMRLKVGPLPPEVAEGLCQTIAGADPWCAGG
jgi:hypothetical protein